METALLVLKESVVKLSAQGFRSSRLNLKWRVIYPVKRTGEIVTATIGRQSGEPTEAFIGDKELHGILERLGLSVETLTKDLARRFHAKEAFGVIISDIEDGGPASLAGLQVGDVIVQVNHKPVKNIDEFIHVLSQIKDNTVLMLVKRQGQSMFVSMQVD